MIINAPTECDAPELRLLWQDSFGDGETFLDTFFATAYSPDRARVAIIDGNVAGALYWFNCSLDGKKYAYIYAVATGKSYRGRGVCTALMRDTHRHLTALGYRGAILVPGAPELFAFYEKMGYSTCSSVGSLFAEPGDKACDIREIDREEYMRLRLKYLPDGAVIQEGENIDFLASLTTLYAGEDFVLAASVEDGVVRGAELLGNDTVGRAGEIVHALGASEGVFRVVGGDIPFAMQLVLDEEDGPPDVPTYFGLAFD